MGGLEVWEGWRCGRVGGVGGLEVEEGWRLRRMEEGRGERIGRKVEQKSN